MKANMYFNGNIKTAIQEHGEAWKDYFSLSIIEMDEFHDQPLPGNFRLDQNRIQRELQGAGGIPAEVKPRKGKLNALATGQR